MALGRVQPHDATEEFCMTVLALKTCRRANAVSSLHGQVSRAMWIPLYPGLRDDHIPIGHITNGVHVGTWLAPQMRQVYERHLGADWVDRSNEPGFWEGIDAVDDGEIWEAHQALKLGLSISRRRAGAGGAENRRDYRHSSRALSSTRDVGFARRFARTNAPICCCRIGVADVSGDTRSSARQLIFGARLTRRWSGKEVLREIAQMYARFHSFSGSSYASKTTT